MFQTLFAIARKYSAEVKTFPIDPLDEYFGWGAIIRGADIYITVRSDTPTKAMLVLEETLIKRGFGKEEEEARIWATFKNGAFEYSNKL